MNTDIGLQRRLAFTGRGDPRGRFADGATPFISQRLGAVVCSRRNRSAGSLAWAPDFGVLQNYVDDIFNSIVHHVMLLQAGCVDLEPDA